MKYQCLIFERKKNEKNISLGDTLHEMSESILWEK